VARPVPKRRREKPALDGKRKKPDFYVANGIRQVDWKDVETLRRFISPKGKMRGRRATGLTRKNQAAVATAIRNAREMALLPYVVEESRQTRRRRDA